MVRRSKSSDAVAASGQTQRTVQTAQAAHTARPILRLRSAPWGRGATFGLGALSVLAFAPLAFAPLSWLALGGLYALLLGSDTGREARWRGFLFGAGSFLFGVSWVYVSLSNFGGMAPPLAVLATVVFCLYLALYPMLAAWGFQRGRGVNLWANVALFAALWGFTEFLRGWVLTGFPWLAIGYAHVPGSGSPLHGLAPVLGVFGVSVGVAALGALGAEAVLRRAAAPALAGVGLLLFGYGAAQIGWTAPLGVPVRVALLQGNVEQGLKWSPSRYAESLRVYHDLMRDHPAALTVLPETAFASYLDQVPQRYIDSLLALAAREQGVVLAGVVVGDRERYTNSLVRLGGGPAELYSKSHLVPFGEFVPPGFDWFMQQMQMPMSGFTPGSHAQVPLSVVGQQVAANICYEDLFGEEIIGALPAATLLVNVSNTAWFGRSWAQPQHLQIAQMRALETGRPMLRATNTGMTAVIGVDGQILARLEPFTQAALVHAVRGYQGMTPYARTGNGAAVGLMILLALPALALRHRARRVP